MVTAQSSDSLLFEKLFQSELFSTYQHAFRSATGLPLRLLKPEADINFLREQCENGSDFCTALNLCKSACQACIKVNHDLMQAAAVEGPTTCHCFSGMSSSAVPVKAAGSVIAILRTGQIFLKTPTEADFARVCKTLLRQGLSQEEAAALHDVYLKTKVVEPKRYSGMLTLLTTFALQLGRHAEKIALSSAADEPQAVARAKKFIEISLAEPICLSEVARHAGLSESHFCRVFKEATTLTLTDYINRRRIEWAKKELLNPSIRISEIAFAIGYQSLSQFNRCFIRFTGISPTTFRREIQALAMVS